MIVIFTVKTAMDENLKSLSIPRGTSQVYNCDKFAPPKHTEHFTDDLTKS